MDNHEFQQAVLAQLQMLNTRLDRVDARLDAMDTRFDAMDARLDGMDARLDRLEAGQTEIRQDIKRLDTKIDTLSADVGQAMVNLTDNVDKEIHLKIIR